MCSGQARKDWRKTVRLRMQTAESLRREDFSRDAFFFNYAATTDIYTLALHDALPICNRGCGGLWNNDTFAKPEVCPALWRTAAVPKQSACIVVRTADYVPCTSRKSICVGNRLKEIVSSRGYWHRSIGNEGRNTDRKRV